MSDQEQIVEFLSGVSLFRELKKRQLERLAKVVVVHDYKADDAIVTQGEGGVGLFVLESGQADVIRQDEDGTRTVVNTFGPGDFFGELALLDEGVRTASVVATKPTKCLGLVRWQFLAVLQDDVDMAILIMQEVARRFRRTLDTL
jgi:CRP/FNR family cyclic AMP-dependent transcriptional regulator